MKVEIHKDQWGIQLCVDKGETGRTLDLDSNDELEDIHDAIETYLEAALLAGGENEPTL